MDSLLQTASAKQLQVETCLEIRSQKTASMNAALGMLFAVWGERVSWEDGIKRTSGLNKIPENSINHSNKGDFTTNPKNR
ncbi:hypothetical protein ACEQPO_03320 [Bacillus sp. SL00103]